MCSLLDDVSEATIRIQRAGETNVSQAMFIMTEVIAMLKEESHPIRVPNTTVLPPPPDGIPTESTHVAELTLEAQGMQEVLLEVMKDKDVGKVSLKVERLCALLDPRRKVLGADQLVNGYTALKTRAEEDLKRVIVCRVCGCTDVAVRACAGASVGLGARGTYTQEEEAFETRGTARGTGQPVVVVTVVAPSLRLPSRGDAC